MTKACQFYLCETQAAYTIPHETRGTVFACEYHATELYRFLMGRQLGSSIIDYALICCMTAGKDEAGTHAFMRQRLRALVKAKRPLDLPPERKIDPEYHDDWRRKIDDKIAKWLPPR